MYIVRKQRRRGRLSSEGSILPDGYQDRTMFFTFTVFPVAIFLFDLKVVVGAVMKGIQKQRKGK